MGTMAAPTVYVFMWMIIFGGAGLRLVKEKVHHKNVFRTENVSLLCVGWRERLPAVTSVVTM